MKRVGIIGCGVIAPTYATTLNEIDFIDLVACSDSVPDRATQLATRYDIPQVAPLDALLADDEIDAVINLTHPKAHGAVTGAALMAGKAVFSEKPLGVEFTEGKALVDAAAERGLRLGCAPDTFLGPGLQTGRDIVERGLIGEPVAANGFMLGPGPEHWHPDPESFYQLGAGPLLDVGPYYLTALVQLLGPARRVTAAARITRADRPILSEPHRGDMIRVETPTHVSTIVEFASGPIATIVTSFDVAATQYRNLEIYGTEATLALPDPNTFGGPVRIRAVGSKQWRDLPLRATHLPLRRGIGAADMLWAMGSGRAHRASDVLALHVLEMMTASIESAETGQRVDLTTSCAPAALLPLGLAQHTFDD
jgi:predicted dehydrogenase